MAKAVRAASHGCLRYRGRQRSLSGSLTVVDQTRQYTRLAKVGGNGTDIIFLHNSQHASGVKSLLDNRGDGALGEALISQQGKKLRMNNFLGFHGQRCLWGSRGRSRKWSSWGRRD